MTRIIAQLIRSAATEAEIAAAVETAAAAAKRGDKLDVDVDSDDMLYGAYDLRQAQATTVAATVISGKVGIKEGRKVAFIYIYSIYYMDGQIDILGSLSHVLSVRAASLPT